MSKNPDELGALERKKAYNRAYRLRPEVIEHERERSKRRQADAGHRLRERERHRRDRGDQEKASRMRAGLKAYYAKHPGVERAHDAVKYALKTGRMTKPDRCEDCPTVDHLHAHHDDYSQPLSVRWLCPRCHKAAHKQERELRCA